MQFYCTHRDDDSDKFTDLQLYLIPQIQNRPKADLITLLHMFFAQQFQEKSLFHFP